MKRKKDLRNSFLISGGAVEIYEFLEIFLKNRIDRCQLVSVNITFSIVDGHFGELFSHAVTTGKFTLHSQRSSHLLNMKLPSLHRTGLESLESFTGWLASKTIQALIRQKINQ